MKKNKQIALLPNYCLVEWYSKKVKYPLKTNGSYFTENIKPGFVYVVKNHDTGFYKIGITNSLNNRLRQLTTQSGCKLSLVLMIELHYDYDEEPSLVESNLHLYFTNKRIVGEWFNLDLKDLLRIRKLFYYIEGEGIEDNISFVLSNDYLPNYHSDF